MSIIRVNNDDVETFTLVTTPNRYFASSSLGGTTGSIKVLPRQSDIEKDSSASSLFNDSSSAALVAQNFDEESSNIKKSVSSKRSAGSPVYSELDGYLSLVDSTKSKETQTLEIERFTPTTRFTKYNTRKNVIKDVLMPHYAVQYQHAGWMYTNYNALNFFNAVDDVSTQLLPTSSVLLYPNTVDPELPILDGHVSGSYCLPDAFSFDFYINPRYKTDGTDGIHFRAGTIFHLSSSYALSLITGSKKDENGYPVGFRLQLQLSHSADFSPSEAVVGNYPHNLTFLSDDNSLSYNKWHHAIVRWGTNLINDGTGSFIVDGMLKGNFAIPSGTVLPKVFTASANPDVLCVGNFYEGPNASSTKVQSLFFNQENALKDGVDLITYLPTTGSEGPADGSYRFSHPLKAEVHDLSIKRYFVSNAEVKASSSLGPGLSALNKKKFAFYVPPFFVEDTPIRQVVNDRGGILQTPFFAIAGTTDDPFNVAMSFGVNGHYINLENFTKDFATDRFPRLLNLSASTIGYTTSLQEANTFLYQQGSVAKRNLTILPCDDGRFEPNYSILTLEDYQNRYRGSNSDVDYSYINLDNLVSESSLRRNGIQTEMPDDFLKEAYGANPEQPGLEPGLSYKTYIASVSNAIASITQDNPFDKGIQKNAPLTIFQRTLDPSSNQITVFNISNLYYGKKILPGSFEIKDVGISGSHGMVKVTLKDNGWGSLYRADSDTEHYKKSSVGNIFYDEGIVVIKSPHLYFFGKNQFEISFKGTQNIHSMKYEIVAGTGLLNSSSNSTYTKELKASGDPQDTQPFVYISGMYFHDENMNVVAKAKFAQPIIKREEDKIMFKISFDF